MTDRELMQQALEILEKHVDYYDYEHFTSVCELEPAKDLILALRERLALEAVTSRADSTCNDFEFYRAAYKQGAKDEREHAAELCEQMGIAGYGTLAIAAVIRARGEKR